MTARDQARQGTGGRVRLALYAVLGVFQALAVLLMLAVSVGMAG